MSANRLAALATAALLMALGCQAAAPRMPWRVSEGLRAHWVTRATGNEPARKVTITVGSVTEKVDIELAVDGSVRYFPVHESAIPVVVAASDSPSASIPRGEIKWTRDPGASNKWSADVEDYTVILFTRPDGPPKIRRYATPSRRGPSEPAYVDFLPVDSR